MVTNKGNRGDKSKQEQTTGREHRHNKTKEFQNKVLKHKQGIDDRTPQPHPHIKEGDGVQVNSLVNMSQQ